MPNLHVAQEIDGTRFKIAGGEAGMKVSWQVTAVRNDPYMREHGAPVEVEKPETKRGFYQHPELYGQPEERGVDYRHRVNEEKRHPEAAQRPEETASDSLEDVENADLGPRVHAPETLEDGEDDERNAIELDGLSDAGGAR